MRVLGIDIGGSGMKAATADVNTGKLMSERHKIATPQPRTPEAIARVVKQLIDHFEWKNPVGCSFPTTIKNGKCVHYGNLDPLWLNIKVDQLFEEITGLPFYVSNDADLASVAEMNLGAGKKEKGVVLLVTIGTEIGSGLFYKGKLISNLEVGKMLHSNGEIIELFTADSVRKKEGLSLKEWATRFDSLLQYIQLVFSPSLVILGGGISKKYDHFKAYLTTHIPVKVAKFRNNAGIIGAPMYARKKMK